jgi:hypothetical protein
MAGFTSAFSATTLDTLFPTSAAPDYIAYSINGTSEWGTSILARTAIGATGWSSATVADPSVKSNANALTSGTTTTAGTVSHFAIYSAITGGTQKTDWTALDTPRALSIGDSLSWAGGAAGAGACKITLT